MNILILLLGPIFWGIIGLFRGRMLVTNKRELRPPHLAKFAWTLILLPILFSLLALTTFLVATKIFDYQDAGRILLFSVFGFMLLLAATLSRAKKHSVPTPSYHPERINISDDEVASSKPDFSNLDDIWTVYQKHCWKRFANSLF